MRGRLFGMREKALFGYLYTHTHARAHTHTHTSALSLSLSLSHTHMGLTGRPAKTAKGLTAIKARMARMAMAAHTSRAPPCPQHTAHAWPVEVRRLPPLPTPITPPMSASAMSAHATGMPGHAPPARRGLMTTRTSRSSTTRHSTHPTTRHHTRTGGVRVKSWGQGAQRAGERREGT